MIEIMVKLYKHKKGDYILPKDLVHILRFYGEVIIYTFYQYCFRKKWSKGY